MLLKPGGTARRQRSLHAALDGAGRLSSEKLSATIKGVSPGCSSMTVVPTRLSFPRVRR